MNGEQQSEGHKREAERFLRENSNDFVLSSAGIHHPRITDNTREIEVNVNAHIDQERTLERPRPNLAEIWASTGVWVQVLVAIGTLIGLIFTVRFAAEQWRMMNLTLEEIRQQTITARLAIAQSKGQFQIDQRPYIWIPYAQYVVHPASPIDAKFVLVNYGKSPALEERGTYEIFFGPDSLKKADDWFKEWGTKLPPIKKGEDINRAGSLNIIPPGIPTDIRTGGEAAIAHSTDIPTSADVNEDIRGKLQIVAVGHYEYKDLANNSYYTNVCYIRIPDFAFAEKGVMAKCNKHNEIH